ncbi:hypothetical protein LCER1_G002032 [Lachnellula cervina]|uniref:Uncharacterized protein n=1 Tax=Lachnellula cervina TaxID=1316786 RepID=A0A7D8YT62_9HELO|nr:hypothetical protein LCER1_G002032 [Lachnellula cervina]
MPPKQRIPIQPATPSRRSPSSKGYFAQTYNTLTSPENASVVRSVVVFGGAVAFFASGWRETREKSDEEGRIGDRWMMGR